MTVVKVAPAIMLTAQHTDRQRITPCGDIVTLKIKKKTFMNDEKLFMNDEKLF